MQIFAVGMAFPGGTSLVEQRILNQGFLGETSIVASLMTSLITPMKIDKDQPKTLPQVNHKIVSTFPTSKRFNEFQTNSHEIQ
jgi:hypothetical protein